MWPTAPQVGRCSPLTDRVLALSMHSFATTHTRPSCRLPMPPAGHAALEKTADYAHAAKEAARTVSCVIGQAARARTGQGSCAGSSPLDLHALQPPLPCFQYGAAAVEATGRALAAGKDLAAVAAEKTKQVPVAEPNTACN
jgi:hypothetical protein